MPTDRPKTPSRAAMEAINALAALTGSATLNDESEAVECAAMVDAAFAPERAAAEKLAEACDNALVKLRNNPMGMPMSRKDEAVIVDALAAYREATKGQA